MANKYVASLLGEQEKILLVTRQHWFNLAINVLPESFLILIVLIGTTVAAVAMPLVPATLFGYLLVLLPLISLIRDVMVWSNHEYIVTNRRIIQVFGVFNKNVTDSSLEKVNDVRMEQTFFGRVFNFGDIEILTASEMGINRFTRIGDPIRFKTAMLNSKARLEQGPAPVQARPMPNIPALIAELGKLHEQGVLSDSEFLSKKAELLSKL